ncbi:polysaccharide biosynthesis/export family protein [Aaestuariibius violaceus]|uniref:polysaccharide biosynthesis/export family protein n=1 Tax=Aestuariibius violaceus TaxID=3234132 RepID=UPI003499E578
MIWLLLAPAAAMSQDGVQVPTLAPFQVLEIRVGRWDPVSESYTAWAEVGGSVTVQSDGSVTLPLVGRVEAAGLTTETIADAIATRLRDRIGLRGEIEAVVTIAEYAPIYVLGDVRAPGEYPFKPGMTVVQALSLAGGIDRPGASFLQGDRSALTAQGNYRVFEQELLRRLATLARLTAERDGREIVVPEELSQASLGEELVAQEARIMQSRASAFNSNMMQIEELETLLRNRIDRLGQQAQLREEQLALVEDELADAQQLAERGLSTAARERDLQRRLADQQVNLLEVETSRLNAEQRLNEARRDRLDLANARASEVVQGIQDQRAAIAELRIRMETEAALYANALGTGSGFVRPFAEVSPDLLLLREEDNGGAPVIVSRTDRLSGGDVLEVRMPLPEMTTETVRRPEVGETPG